MIKKASYLRSESLSRFSGMGCRKIAEASFAKALQRKLGQFSGLADGKEPLK
jgi:hypothetical protein